MLTDVELADVMPLLPAADRTRFLAPLNQAMREFGITTWARECAFLAQIAHESQELRTWREIWGPTDAQRRYEGRKDLGNTEPGDGFRYRGRGPIQITGRANYAKYGQLLGINLETNPDLALQPLIGFRIAGCFWARKGLNPLADTFDFREITRRINGGLNGYADRVEYYERAKRVLSRDDAMSQETPIKVVVNGEELPDAGQLTPDGVTILLRPVAEALGARVQWDGKSKTVRVDRK